MTRQKKNSHSQVKNSILFLRSSASLHPLSFMTIQSLNEKHTQKTDTSLDKAFRKSILRRKSGELHPAHTNDTETKQNMNTTMIVEDVDGAVIDKNETDHDGSLQISPECDHPSRQSVSCHAPKITLSPVARLVKPVMVAAALMMSVPSVSFATVSFNEGQIVDKSGDTYSVKQPGGSVWSGVERSELTAQQIKGYEMAQAAAKAKGDALTTANQTRTQQQIQAGAQAMMVSLTTSKMASANSTINVSAGSLGDMPVKTAHGETVLASSLPANTQVSKPYNSALFGSVTRASNGGNNSNSGEGSHGGTGNGGENAQASHSAGGFSDDHDHIGGGHTGGGFHY